MWWRVQVHEPKQQQGSPAPPFIVELQAPPKLFLQCLGVNQFGWNANAQGEIAIQLMWRRISYQCTHDTRALSWSTRGILKHSLCSHLLGSAAFITLVYLQIPKYKTARAYCHVCCLLHTVVVTQHSMASQYHTALAKVVEDENLGRKKETPTACATRMTRTANAKGLPQYPHRTNGNYLQNLQTNLIDWSQIRA